MVPSDVAAGLVLVRLQQRASVLSLKKVNVSGGSMVRHLTRVVDRELSLVHRW